MESTGWTPQDHPRLFFDAKDVEALRAKRTADGISRTLWRHVQEEIEKGMALEMPRESPRWEFDTGADGQLSRLLYKGILPLVQDWADPLTRLPISTHIMPAGNWWENCVFARPCRPRPAVLKAEAFPEQSVYRQRVGTHR